MLIQQKAIPVPEGIDIVEFIKSGGKVEKIVAPPSRITFADLQKRYLETHANGAMEPNSLVTVRIHLRHFAKSLGDRFKMQELALANLQDYLNERSQKKYRGIRLSPSLGAAGCFRRGRCNGMMSREKEMRRRSRCNVWFGGAGLFRVTA